MHNIRMWIKRDAEGLVRELGKQFPVVFVTGARQVGKTSILTRLFPDFSYITLDDPARAAEAAPFLQLMTLSPFNVILLT